MFLAALAAGGSSQWLGAGLVVLLVLWVALAYSLQRPYVDVFRRTLDEVLVETNLEYPELLAIRLKKKETNHLKEIEALTKSGAWILTKSFSNQQGDKVLILSHQPQTNGSLQ